jgi:hypothetical protein
MDQLKENAINKFGNYFNILDFLQNLVLIHNNDFKSPDKLMMVAPLHKYILLKEMLVLLPILEWHLEYASGK